jgi:hypothetical protein
MEKLQNVKKFGRHALQECVVQFILPDRGDVFRRRGAVKKRFQPRP